MSRVGSSELHQYPMDEHRWQYRQFVIIMVYVAVPEHSHVLWQLFIKCNFFHFVSLSSGCNRNLVFPWHFTVFNAGKLESDSSFDCSSYETEHTLGMHFVLHCLDCIHLFCH